MSLASLRPYIALWGLRGAWTLSVALWALALLPWFVAPAPQAAAAAARAAVPQGAMGEREVAAQSASAGAGGAEIEPAAVLPERVARDDAVCVLSAAGEVPSTPPRPDRLARLAAPGLQQAFEALRRRAEVPSQAAAWWLRVLLARHGSAAGCTAGTACDAPVAAELPTLSVAIDALAQLAQVNDDAWVQQIAQRACAGAASAACASLGARRWGMLQPDNAAAWLELTAADAQAADEALFRAARAGRFDAQRGRLAAQVLLATPAQGPPLQRYAAWRRAGELERDSDAATASAALRACSDGARRDANRAQLCDAAARWLASLRATATDAAAAGALDCAGVEQQWREARERVQQAADDRAASAGPAHP